MRSVSALRSLNPRRLLGGAAAACLVALLTACPGEINGRVDRIGGPIGGPISGGPGGGGPIDSVDHEPFASITAGNGYTCALTELGVAYCWGGNGVGQLGVGDTLPRYVPTQVESPVVFREIVASGLTTCAISDTGAGYCWGFNHAGQLGVGDTTKRTLPERVIGAQSWASIIPSFHHTCGVDGNATAWCWGMNEQAGQLGDSTRINRREPVQVRTSFSFAEVHPAETHTCGRRTDGVIMCWGSNPFNTRLGRSGPGTLTPRAINSTETFSLLDAIDELTCAIESAQPRVQCWGTPDLIGSTTGDGVNPQRVALNVDVTTISLGGKTACALDQNGQLYCWGDNSGGTFANGTNRSSATPVAAVTDLRFRAIAVGQGHACGITIVRTETYCWGSNSMGQLGAGRNAPVYTFSPIATR